MKKVVLLALFVFSSLSIFSQEKLLLEKVITVDSVQKEYIYNSIKEWIGLNYVSAKKVIEIDDKEAGLIIMNATTTYTMGKLRYLAYDGYLSYTIKIQIKDNRFKVEITNFLHKSNSETYREYWSLGLLTNSTEFQGKCSGLEKPYFNNVWIDLKQKSEVLSNELIRQIEKIDFSNKKEDNW